MFFVRTASVRDADKLQRLLHETWHATYDPIHGPDKVDEICQNWHSLDEIKRKIEKRQAEYIVADDGTQMGGMAFANGANDKGIAHLNQIYVLPDLQGQGIGADLLREIEECFPEAKAMRLEVDVENSGAIAFYKRMGYTQIGRTEDSGGAGDDIPALIMEKSL